MFIVGATSFEYYYTLLLLLHIIIVHLCYLHTVKFNWYTEMSIQDVTQTVDELCISPSVYLNSVSHIGGLEGKILGFNGLWS